ncbi:MAG: efflux RND transporter permease subunit [Pseudomonadales bacterium]
MIDIAKFSIDRPIYGWILVITCLLLGYIGIESIGRLEDPPFPVKTAYVITQYPGASALEVEKEVTDQIEAALQELPYVDHMISKSVNGRSEIQIDMLQQYGLEDTPQIYDELRRRVGEAAYLLPAEANPPIVEDDFGDVYGIVYAISAPGFTTAEKHNVANNITTALKGIEHVAKVDVRGLPLEAIYIEVPQQRLKRLGLTIDELSQGINLETNVTTAGSTRLGNLRLTVAPGTPFSSVEDIRNMPVGPPGSTQILKLGDIAEVRRENIEKQFEMIRHDGHDVFAVAVAVTEGENVVEVGRNVDAKMDELVSQTLPLGVSYEAIFSQHEVVSEAIDTFLVNLVMSVVTVVLALLVFMGWRAGTVVGLVLFLTVLGTIGIMYYVGIPLQRISLGALMIAMGMLVDNGIVVAEGVVVGVARGLTPREAASRAVTRTQFALLGATIIGITAFAPISLSNDNTGHFLISLFQVIAISLLLSWILAITVVPLFSSYLLKVKQGHDQSKEYTGLLYRPYKLLLGISLRRAWLATLVIMMIFASSIYGLGFVRQSFFPSSNSPLFFVDYQLAEGTDIHYTQQDVKDLEPIVEAIDGVEHVTIFTGRGPPRFAATTRPEQPNSAYAQIVVRVDDVRRMNQIMAEAQSLLSSLRIDAEIRVSRTEFSPTNGSKIEARFSGPDIKVLRQLAAKAREVYLAHNLIDTKTNWRAPSLELQPIFNESQARVSGITRRDVAQALNYNTEGVSIGVFRDGDKLVPIVARAPRDERQQVSQLGNKEIWSPLGNQYVPLTQVVDGLELVATDAKIYRRDRVRTITAQANAPQGQNVRDAQAMVMTEVDAIKLPPGYHLEWGGEYEANIEANTSLGSKIPLAFGFMMIITILMFGQLRQPIVIWLTVPMIITGVVIGMLATNHALTFPSFLGVLSLSGMLIKNCIVLVDEIDKQMAETGHTVKTIYLASISRLRPVLLAAGTTIAGMSPLLTDAFFREMAICIMSGLLFSTLITLIAIPVFYRIALGNRVTAMA